MFFRSFCLLWILSILSLVGPRYGILYPLVPLRHLFATWELRCWNYFFCDVNGDDREILHVRRFSRVWVENALLLMQKSKWFGVFFFPEVLQLQWRQLYNLHRICLSRRGDSLLLPRSERGQSTKWLVWSSWILGCICNDCHGKDNVTWKNDFTLSWVFWHYFPPDSTKWMKHVFWHKRFAVVSCLFVGCGLFAVVGY